MKKTWKFKVTAPEEFEPSAEARAIYDKYWAEAQTRQRSSSENFDKSILTYSSSGLAISLAFLKDFVPAHLALHPGLLYFSWLCFVLATGLTILSFMISYKAQELSVEYAEQYLINGIEEYRNKKTWRGAFIKWSNIVSGVAFVAALIATSFFVGLNLDRSSEMTDKKHVTSDGMPTAVMQKIQSNGNLQKGLPTASIPQAPATQKPAAPPQSQPASNTSSNNQKS